MAYIETELLIKGIQVNEPVTVLTNILLSGLTFHFYLRLNKVTQKKSTLLSYWKFFFLFLSIANLIAVVSHGFKSYIEPNTYYYVWMFMNLASFPSSYFLLLSNLEVSYLHPKKHKWYYWFIQLLTLLLVVSIYLLNTIELVKLNAGLVILITLWVHIKSHKNGLSGSYWIYNGFLLSLICLPVHTYKISLHPYFNFKDISHVIMLVSLYFIFLGMKNYLETAETETKKAV